MSFLREFFEFARQRKKLWLLPLFIVFATLGALLILAKGSAIAPFVYTIF
jgi:hypothetical protein